MNNFIPIPSLKNDGITLIFLLIFILLVVVKLIYNERLFLLTTIGISKKYFLNYGKESRLIFNGFNSILFIVQSLIGMLIVYAFLQFYQPELVQESSFLLLKIFLGLSIIFLIRYLIGKGFGILFDVENTHNHISFEKMSYLFSILLLILPFLLLVFYIEKYNFLFFQLLIAVLTILLTIRYLFLFSNNKKQIASRLFYFILYLCALEIAPIFIIYKIFDKIVII
jgi:hypothetical protein